MIYLQLLPTAWCSAGSMPASPSASRWSGASSTSSTSCTARSSCWALCGFLRLRLPACIRFSVAIAGRAVRARLHPAGRHHQPRDRGAGADDADADVRPRSPSQQRDAARVHRRLSQGQPRPPLGTLEIGPVFLPGDRVAAMALALLLTLLLYRLLRDSRIGRAIVAVRMDREAAALMGVDVRRINAITFGIGAFMAGAAGACSASSFRSRRSTARCSSARRSSSACSADSAACRARWSAASCSA